MEPDKNGEARAASAVFFDAVARRILADHPPPDLRGVVVLLPNYHAAQPLARALMRAARVPALLLPEMLALNDWAQTVTLDASVAADSRRGALLYQHLRKQKWFDNADLWGMTRELLKLFDEITSSMRELPADAESFAAAVERAYEARRNESLQLEARLVFELWHAMQSDSELDAARAYQQRLAKLAQQAEKPLYVLRTAEWDTVEQRFLDEYARRAVVEVFDVRKESNKSVRPELVEGRKLQHAARLSSSVHGSTGSPRTEASLRFFPATSQEQEARAAAMQIRLWLNEGKRDIAVVAQDRVAARRVRALLERADVLVADESGWTFATLAVSTALDRWLTALQSDFYHHDLLDLLKSPFIFSDVSASERKGMVYKLEQLLRKHGVVAGLEAFFNLAGDDAALHAALERLRQAAQLLNHGKRRTLAEWLEGLRESLVVLGMDGGLRQDDAGRQLLAAFDGWRQELADDAGRYGFNEWRRWLAQQLDIETYQDRSIESPVRFTHLAATRWRAFDAVLLLGCDADHLPSVPDTGSFFNDAVRFALGLPTRAFHAQRQRDDLHALLAMNDCVLATWQKEKNGEQRLLSPYLQVLREGRCEARESVHISTSSMRTDSIEQRLHALLALEDAHKVDLPQAAQPAPSVTAETVPASISISAYNSLVACPYQFHARHILRLNELDEVQEAIEKRDYGDLVHKILQRFHQRYPRVSEHATDEMAAALRRISEEAFSELIAHDFAARAWLARWFDSLPAYLEWQVENEAQGWRYVDAERGFSVELESVRLRGRLDRLDAQGDEKRVLDYKTQSTTQLGNKLKEAGEDVQLACYAYAEGAADAAFVSIESGKVKSVAPPHDVSELARLNVARLQDVMTRIRDGAAMPANGIEQACAYCEVRGVCRKGEW